MEVGDRVELVYTSDEYTKMKPGEQGTVKRVRDGAFGEEIDVAWDCGSRLTMLSDVGDRLAPA